MLNIMNDFLFVNDTFMFVAKFPVFFHIVIYIAHKKGIAVSLFSNIVQP